MIFDGHADVPWSHAILAAIPDLVFLIDRDGRYIDILAESDDGLLLPRNELIGKRWRARLRSRVGMNGVEATRILHGEFPDMLVIGLSMYTEDHRANEMHAAGAVDYISKEEPSDVVIATILECCRAADQRSTARG